MDLDLSGFEKECNHYDNATGCRDLPTCKTTLIINNIHHKTNKKTHQILHYKHLNSSLLNHTQHMKLRDR